MSTVATTDEAKSGVVINNKEKSSEKKQKPSKKAIKIKIFDNKGKE